MQSRNDIACIVQTVNKCPHTVALCTAYLAMAYLLGRLAQSLSAETNPDMITAYLQEHLALEGTLGLLQI